MFYKNTLSKITAVFVLLPKGSGARLPDLGRQVSEWHRKTWVTGPGRELRVPRAFLKGVLEGQVWVSDVPPQGAAPQLAVTSDTCSLLIFHPPQCINRWLRELQGLTH